VYCCRFPFVQHKEIRTEAFLDVTRDRVQVSYGRRVANPSARHRSEPMHD
jgi:hypothetical protein